MNTPSRLHPKFQSGVIIISGLWGLGQSTLAFTAERPNRTVILLSVGGLLGQRRLTPSTRMFL